MIRRHYPKYSFFGIVLILADGGFLLPRGGNVAEAFGGDLKSRVNNGGLQQNLPIFPDGPSAFPTESPAPSPSPSDEPTSDPATVTDSPTAYPTESPAPSPSPSDTPTIMPTSVPSDAPSMAPSLSAQPSYVPSAVPSDMPSDSPSTSPTAAPSVSAAPSEIPSALPSDVPSDVPSLAPSSGPTTTVSPSAFPSTYPSSLPSLSPTLESFKTKTSETVLVLADIDTKMDEFTLARFEIATLEFIRQAQPNTRGYEIDILAVTVLTQNVVHSVIGSNETTSTGTESEASDSTRRGLQFAPSDWDVALEVGFRTVGVVTSGRVPEGFKFEEVSEYGFETNFDQYLWQLGNSNEFFYPLRTVSNYQPESTGDQGQVSKAPFVIAILFSLIAFGIAIVASWFAIRRHLAKQKNGKRRSNKYDKDFAYDNDNLHPTYSNSEDEDKITYMPDASGILPFGVSTTSRHAMPQDDEKSLESVGLTPRGAKCPGGFDDEIDDDNLPLQSPNTLEKGCVTAGYSGATCGTNFGLGGGPSIQIFKKWMTPRQSTENYSNVSKFSAASTAGRFDPPENEDHSKIADAKPSAGEVKTATSTKAGVITDEATVNPNFLHDTADDGQYTLPISFFSKGTEYQSDFDAGTPMSSLAGSNGSSSFLFNIGKSFAGRNSSNGGGRLSETGGSIKLEEIATNPTIQETYAFSEITTRNSEAASALFNNQRPGPSTRKSDPRRPKIPKKPDSKISYNATAYNTSPKNGNNVRQAVAQIQQKQQEMQKQQARKIPSPVYNEASERGSLGSNAGTDAIEVTMGARSMDQADDSTNTGSSKNDSRSQNQYQKNQSQKANGDPEHGASSDLRRLNKPVRVSSFSANQNLGFTLGARPLAESVEAQYASDKTTLSTAIGRPGTYDVYAPSGPIGIVVDTSKDGPCVHSLKSTSPMLGLISAGDLIIALDDEDTRGMTAAALTRLMAKKSRQRERKITLFSLDGF